MVRPRMWCAGPARRSTNACRYLAEQGIEVVNVAGGMLAWVDEGFETVTGAASGAADD